MKIDTGIDTRVVVSGIAEYYKSEDIIGKQVNILVNLAPRKIRGIESKGMILMAENPEGKLVHIVTQYYYNDKLVMAEGSWTMTPTFGFQMSFNIAMEKATLVYDLTRKPTFQLCPSDKEAFTPQVQEGDGWFLEIEHFAKAIRGEKVEPIITLAQSMNSVRIVEAEKKSILKMEVVRID